MFSKGVAVIGGGTAGFIAAKAAAACGIRTVVHEQKAQPGVSIHASGILSLTGLETLGMDYKEALTNTLTGANLHANGSVMRIRSKDAVAVVLDRKKLNTICMNDAVKAGATVKVGERVSASGLQAVHKENIIIGADGCISTVAKHFSMGSIPKYVLTYKEEYNVEAAEPGVVDLFFDNKSFPGLFAWLCPNAKDVLEVGVGLDPSAGNSRRAMERFMATKEVSGLVKGAKMIGGGASMIPLGRREMIVDDSRDVMLVGDAAGQVKAMTGGGIIFGSNAAMMAAKAAADKIGSGKSLAVYEKNFMKRYGLEMTLHGITNRFYSSMSPAALGMIIRASNALGIDSFLAEYGDMDRPSLVIKRFFLRGLAN